MFPVTNDGVHVLLGQAPNTCLSNLILEHQTKNPSTVQPRADLGRIEANRSVAQLES